MARLKVGFIGIGVMGDPMVRNLLKARFPVTVFDVTSSRMAGVIKAGARGAASNAELAADSDVVIVMVNTTDQARQCLFGKKGVWETVRKGATVVLMSSIDPYFCQTAAKKAKRKGVNLLDVPVSGAGDPVKEGTLTLFVGGDKAVLAKVRPVLEAVGNKIFHMGKAGAGEVAKLCNNYIVTVTNAVLADSIRIASKSGVDLETFRQSLMTSTANSGSVQRAWYQLTKETAGAGQKLEKHFPVNLYEDLRLTMDLARRTRVFAPIAGVTAQLDLTRYRAAEKGKE